MFKEIEYLLSECSRVTELLGVSGLNFNPSDRETILQLLPKVGQHNMKTHPFIDEFILNVDDGSQICYVHLHKLPDQM